MKSDQNPIAIDEISAMLLNPYTVTAIKNVDCTTYNKCLDVAVKNDWPGFSCRSCKGYQRSDKDQLEADNLALKMAYEASGYIHEYGNAHRVVGVRPGGRVSNRSKSYRLPMLIERSEVTAEEHPLRNLVIG